MYARPDTTSAPTFRFVSGNSDFIQVEIPDDEEQWWSIRSVDWSTDRKPCPVGVVEIKNVTNNTILWRQFFTNAGRQSKEFEHGVLFTERGSRIQITVSGKNCNKNLGVLYR